MMRGTMALSSRGWLRLGCVTALMGAACSDDGVPASGSASATGTDDSLSSDATIDETSADTTPGSATQTGTGTSQTTAATTTDPSGPGDTGTTAVDTSSSDPTGSSDATGSGSGDSGDSSASASESSSGGGTDTGAVEDCTCAPGTDVIYVLSDNAELWSFDPVTYDFAFVGAFQCANEFGTFSMGVDRKGIAWVMFQSADLYTIDVNNPAMCVDPGYNPNQMGFGLFGMAFVSESVENPCDRLYGNTYSGGLGFQEGPNFGTLGSLDPASLLIDPIGSTDYDGAELTGTGDGRLFGFAGVNPAKLVEFDKTDATVLDILPLGALELTNAFAFGFFGGDFYMFTENNTGLASQVTHLDYDDSDMSGMQELEVVVDAAPIRIVGAGVSTCVPVIDPQ